MTHTRIGTADLRSVDVVFPHSCAHELFERQVRRSGRAIAVTCGKQTMTYRELNERANQLAHLLRRRGVGPDTLVGVAMHRSPQLVAALLGIWKAGAAYVPIDPTYPAERLSFMVADSAVHTLITDPETESLFSHAADRMTCLDARWTAIAHESRANPGVRVTPENLAYVIYTSGSTGRPKGALIQHDGLVNYVWWAIDAYDVHPGDVVPVHSSIAFDLTVTSLYPALLAGAQVELLPEDAGAQNLISSLRDGRCRGLVKITPAHLELLTHQITPNSAATVARAFVIGGENLTAESLRFWREHAPLTRLINEYGPTETVVGCCVHEVGPEDPDSGSVPIGRPIANAELHVLDDALEPVAAGEKGELYIGGVGVARGYLNRPDLTRERFLPDPFSGREGARLYKTGDVARYRVDGVLEYLGRCDDQVKIRGYRIELGEIESVLAGHPDVRGASVVVHEPSPGDKRLIAYAVARREGAVSLDALRQYLGERLPEYMVPSHFMFLDALPLTRNGKVDRQALPAPDYDSTRMKQEFVSPRSDTERHLADIWRGVLKLDRIGVHDDVFDLGASSLMVVAAGAQIEMRFGVTLEFRTLFENPTIEQLTVALEKKRATRNPVRTIDAPVIRLAPKVESRASAIRFGPAERELVGLYHPPSGGRNASAACVLCNPFGQEAMRSHRVFRILAERLATSGFHVLRFDYFGTGDSPGEEDASDVEGWIADVLRASDTVMERGGCSRSVWLGLRLGATVAALASARATRPPSRLVLWDPITDGTAYLNELANAHVAFRKAQFRRRWDVEPALRARALEEARNEALGHALPPSFKVQLDSIRPESFARINATAISLFTGRTGGEVESARRALQRAGTSISLRTTSSNIDWLVNDMLSDSIIPADDVRTMIEEMAEAS